MSHNHNEFSEHSKYSERVTKRFVDKDVTTTPSTVRVLQAVAIAGTVLTYVDYFLLNERRGWLSLIIGAFLCFFICRFVVRGLGARNGTARMIGFICAILSVVGGALGLAVSFTYPTPTARVVFSALYLVLGIAWFLFDWRPKTKRHFEPRQQ